jgi:PTS system galactitol-specific IIA component
MLLFDDDYVALNVKVENSKDVIFLLSGMLEKKGVVSAKYGEAAYKRELSYPTGLPTKPFFIAFPHADCEEVYQSALAVATLAKPVVFKSMEDPEIELPVHIVILLANRSPDEQVKVLRQLAIIFGKPEKLTELRNHKTISDLVAWMRKELKLETNQ